MNDLQMENLEKKARVFIGTCLITFFNLNTVSICVRYECLGAFEQTTCNFVYYLHNSFNMVQTWSNSGSPTPLLINDYINRRLVN